MPLIVRDYTWEETEKCVFITIPLKGVKAEKVDILCSEEYVKVSYPPYLFECLLFALVDEDESKAKIGDGVVVLTFPKKEMALWEQLQSPDAGNKEIMKNKRNVALEQSQLKAEREGKRKAEEKTKQEKFALKEMMSLETKEKTRIDDEKEFERRKATEDLERWKEEQKQLAEEKKKYLLEKQKESEAIKKAEQEANQFEERKNRKNRKKNRNIFEEEGVPKREVGRIEVKFTPRVFPTAMRESQTEKEEEWLRKQAEASRIISLDDKDLSEEEKNPIFLRDKGNSFFQSGNYLAAVNAYSHAIRLSPNMPSLYSNRAACHLRLRNCFKCIEDCSKALELLTPPVPQNLSSRCKAMIRRGTAFCELELYVEGLQDYEAVLKLDPLNSQVREDAEKMRSVIQSTTSS